MDSPTGVDTLNSSLSCSGETSKFIATYGVTKHKLALRSNNAQKVKSKTQIISMKTFGKFSCSWRLVRAYMWFAPPPVPEVAPLGALFREATDED